MNIQELCLVPKNILENILASKETNLLKKEVVDSPFDDKTSKPNLENDIKNLFTMKIKVDNALNLYNWIYKNVKDLSLSSNGNVMSPLGNFNLIEFIKDVHSSTKNFTNDKLGLYKVWVAIIDLPIHFIKNEFIKNYIFPNHFDKYDEISPKSNKRKLAFEKPINLPKRDKKDIEIRSPIKTRKSSVQGSGILKWVSY